MAGRCWHVAATVVGGLLLWTPQASAQPASADLAVTSATPSTSASLLTINADVVNKGPGAAAAPVITFAVPAGLDFARGSVATVETCALDSTARLVTCTWPSPPVAAGLQTSAVVTFTNTGLPAGSALSIGVQISSATPDPDPSNNTAAVPVTLAGGPVPTVPGGVSADLAVTSVAPAAAPPVGTALFLWDVTNQGVAPAQGVIVTFTIPAAARFANGNVATVECTVEPGGATASCRYPRPLISSQSVLASLALDTSATPAGTPLMVRITAGSTTPDPDPANNVGTATVRVPGQGPASTTTPLLVPTGGGGLAPVLLSSAFVALGLFLIVATRPGRRDAGSA